MDIQDKVHENRVRRMADRQMLRLERIRRRDPDAPDFAGYVLRNAEDDVVLGGAGLNCASLDQVEAFLKDATKRSRYIRGPDGAFHWQVQPRASVSDFDPARDGIYERKLVEGMGDRLHALGLKLQRRDQDVARLEHRNVHLESELRLLGQHHNNALKDIIMLKQQLAKQQQGGGG